MNFKLTKLKSIFTAVTAVIVGFFSSYGATCWDCTNLVSFAHKTDAAVQGFVFTLIAMYLVWSLIEKKA